MSRGELRRMRQAENWKEVENFDWIFKGGGADDGEGSGNEHDSDAEDDEKVEDQSD